MLYFSDTARLEERFYIGFEKYLMLGRENGAETCIRTTERAIADWLPFNTRRNHSYIANTILFGYGTLRGALLYRFWKISHAGSWERGQNVPTHNNDAHNEYCKSSNFRRNHSYIANAILFGYGTLRGALLYRFWKISHSRSWERGQNVPSHNNDAHNEYCKGSNFRRNHSYIANTILFRYSTLRGALLYRFWRISHARSWERGQNVYTHNRTCNCGLATLQFSKKP